MLADKEFLISGHSGMASMLSDVQQESILFALPALSVAGFAFAMHEPLLPPPFRALSPGLLIFIWPLAVLVLRQRSYVAAAWLLVLGYIAADLYTVTWLRVSPVLCLLALPAGLATLLISTGAGTLATLGLSVLLLLAPAPLVPADATLRLTALTGVWGALGLVWLTLRSLLTTIKWSWSAYEQSHSLLERARDYQVQLKQTLADLADANLQLTRLDRLSQSLRQAAEEARQAKAQFVANVSHELRTPLNMIIGFSEMIVRAPQTYGASLPPTLLADLAVILRNSQHLSSLIDDVLDLSQIEAGRVALTRERVVLADIVESAATAVRPLFASKGLYLETDLDPALPPVLCDRTRIGAVLLNLLSNAGRFTEQGGVRVRMWREGGMAVVSVADSGPGIAEQDKERLFQPFQQVDGSVRRRYGGSGLGLAISKGFVELHGGQMWLESAPGLGTTLFFRLPIDPPPSIESGPARWISPHWEFERAPRRSSAPAPMVRPRFVVLEETGHSLQHLLARFMDNVETTCVSTPEEALEEIARVPAQALLCNSPSVSTALQQLSQITTLPEGTPVIASSILGPAEAASALGAADYLVKPISREALLAALARLQLKGKTILIVDDEPEALRLFQRMLTTARRGYHVLRASDGDEALSILRTRQIDAILLDLVMPGMDGFHLLETRSQDPALAQIPVLITSARDPTGQPIVSSVLAVTRAGGVPVPQFLACIRALSAILSTTGQAEHPALPEKLAG